VGFRKILWDFSVVCLKVPNTPLGFFTLAVLIVEAILAVFVARASGLNFSVLLGSMIVLIFVLVAFMVFIVLRRPNLLFGLDAAMSDDTRILSDELQRSRAEVNATQSAITRLEHQVNELTVANTELKNRLDGLSSLKQRVWALINYSNSVSLKFILENLDALSRDARDDVLNAIGILLDEGKIENYMDGYYKAVKK
jgi:energy-coupling factor transporter transmembrane protein EcfT